MSCAPVVGSAHLGSSSFQLAPSGILSQSRQQSGLGCNSLKILLLLAASGVIAHAQAAAVGSPASTLNTPFQHVIVVIQENRTPTNLFQDPVLMQNGAHLVQTGSCHGTQITLTPWPLNSCFDQSHAHTSGWEVTYDHGLMDGACDVLNNPPQGCDPPLCPKGAKSKYCPEYTYVPNLKFDEVHGILDPYYQLAEQYGYANYMFQTNQGPSFPAHQFLISGTSAPTAYPNTYYDWFAAENYGSGIGTVGLYGCIAALGSVIQQVDPSGNESSGFNGGYPCYEHATLPDLLTSQNPPITWRYYAAFEAGSLWNAPNAIDHMCVPGVARSGACAGTDWTGGNVVTAAGQVLTDISNCQLPQVSWVIPDGNWSDHPGGTDGGPSWIAAIVNAIGQSKCASPAANWGNTAILITWDDWGGFFDDVNPEQHVGLGYKNGNGNGQSYVYGFRVPLLVVSTYTRQTGGASKAGGQPASSTYSGYMSNVNHDFGSILNFIEYVFGQNGQSIGTIGPPQFPYADFFAPDAPPSDPNSPYGLSDFFNFNKSHAFQPVTGAKYPPSCFFNPKSCFKDYPQAPDNDAYDDDGD
jgi:phosphoesterase family protein